MALRTFGQTCLAEPADRVVVGAERQVAPESKGGSFVGVSTCGGEGVEVDAVADHHGMLRADTRPSGEPAGVGRGDAHHAVDAAGKRGLHGGEHPGLAQTARPSAHRLALGQRQVVRHGLVGGVPNPSGTLRQSFEPGEQHRAVHPQRDHTAGAVAFDQPDEARGLCRIDGLVLGQLGAQLAGHAGTSPRRTHAAVLRRCSAKPARPSATGRAGLSFGVLMVAMRTDQPPSRSARTSSQP